VVTWNFCGQIVAGASKILPGNPPESAGIALTGNPEKEAENTRESLTSYVPKVSVAPMMDWTDDSEISGGTGSYEGQNGW
jgi:hypothetical protein